MRLRSLLFVPGDRPDRTDEAAASGADALILDLEDSVVAERKELARATVAARLGKGSRVPVMVRVNPLGGPLLDADLDSLAGTSPAAIVLPKAEGAPSILGLAGELAKRGFTGIPILPIATETPASIFRLGSYAEAADALLGMTWGAEDLPAAIGATSSREADGSYTPPYEMVRAMLLFAAHHAGVLAIETIYPDFRDCAGLAAYARRGRRDGFSAMLAIHPAQVETINRAFTPTGEEIAYAHRVVELFRTHPEAGTLALDGRMLDAPHLRQAQRILADAGEPMR